MDEEDIKEESGFPRNLPLVEVLAHNPKPRHILTTTYTLNLVFFESEIFRELNTHVLETAAIFADPHGYSQAMMESSILLQAGQAYRVFPVPGPGTFHPKVWLTHGDKGTLLVVGSGNLTPSGFNGNTEVFDALYITDKSPLTPGLRTQILDFLEGLQDQMTQWTGQGHEHSEVFTTWKGIVKKLPVSDQGSPFSDVSFLHSYRGKLMDQLPADVRNASRFYVAAPYFGGGLGGVQLLQQSLSPGKMSLYPAVDEKGGIDFPMGNALTLQNLEVYPTPAWRNASSFVHAKLYGFRNASGPSFIFCTSANATKGAWEGPNIEAGLLRTIPAASLEQLFPQKESPVPLPFHPAMDQQKAQEVVVLLFSAVLELFECRVNIFDVKRAASMQNGFLILRCGRHEWHASAKGLFDAKGQARFILQDLFPDIDVEALARRVLRLEIRGESADGKIVQGIGIIHNSGRLSWDAVQRKSSDLMDAVAKGEGLPSLGGLAEVLTRLRGMLDEKVYAPRSDITRSRQVEVKGLQPISAGTAVWPAIPLDKVGALGMSPASMARMMLLTEYYKNLFHVESDPARSDAASSSTGKGFQSEKDEELGTELSEQEQKKLGKRLKSYKQIVDTHFEKLGAHLATLHVDQDSAPNLWLVSFAAFIPLLFIMRKMPEKDPAFQPDPRPIEMCKTFIRWMCQSNAGKPAIANLLTHKYQMPPPTEIKATLLAMLAGIHHDFLHESMAKHDFHAMWKIYLHAIDADANAVGCDVASCWFYWQKHLEDPLSPLTKQAFSKSYAALLSVVTGL